MADKTLERMRAGELVLTQARLKEVLDYDTETGFFARKRLYGGPIGSRAGSYSRGYRIIRIDDRNYREHRLAWLYVYGKWPDNYIDHINGIRDDNRIANLRDVTKAVNQQNLRAAQSNSSTGLLGVRVSRNWFQAYIKPEGRRIYLGTFKTPEEAHAAYMEAKRKHHEGCTI